MRFYVLASYNLWSFEQTVRCLPSDRTQVVINTLDETYEQRLINACIHYKLPYVITESDGTPATGKNSMMKIFLESNDDYGVFIDGGDIITPTGYDYYTNLAQHHNPPDLLVLYKQTAVYHMDVSKLEPDMHEDDFPAKWRVCYPCDKSRGNIYNMKENDLYDYLKRDARIGHDEATLWSKERYIFHQLMNTYSEDYEYMTRMVFISRKAAEHMYYETFTPKNRPIGEDTIQYFRLKRLAHDGKLRVFKKRDGQGKPPTYIQNLTEKGVSKGDSTIPEIAWDWVIPINRKIEDMIEKDEMPIPNGRVPDWD